MALEMPGLVFSIHLRNGAKIPRKNSLTWLPSFPLPVIKRLAQA